MSLKNNSPFAELKGKMEDFYKEKEDIDKLTKQQAFFLLSPYKYTWFCGGIGAGKCFQRDTPFIKYDGSIVMSQDIRVGDVLMGWDSTPRPVTSIASGFDDIYEIIPVKGESHKVNSHHILTLKRKDESVYDITLKQFMSLSKSSELRINSFLFKVRIDFNKKETRLHPYFGYIRDDLDVSYVVNSRENRLETLAGMLDYEGEIIREKYQIETFDVNKKEKILFLCRSLGFEVFTSKSEDKFKITINGDLDEIPVRFLRKPNKKFKAELKSRIKEIKHIGKDTYYGFTVIGDGRVVLGDFTVTHNTFIGSRYATERAVTNPETIGLITANTYDQLNHATLPPFMSYLDDKGIEYVKDKIPPVEWGFRPRLGSYRNVMTLDTGCHILLRSLDNFEAIRGVEIGWGWMDEIQGTTKKAWDVIVGRLRCKYSHRREIRVTGTPQGENWTWDEFSNPKNRKTHKVVFASTLDNPTLSDDYLEGLFSNYDAYTALQEIYGKIVKTNDGKIYYNYSLSRNVSDIMAQYDPSQPLLLGWDFNIGIRPMSCVVAQIHYSRLLRKDIVVVLDELVIPFSNTPQIMKLLIERYQGHTGQWRVFGDTQGLTRGASAGVTDYFVIEEELMKAFGRQMPNGEPKVIMNIPRTNPLVADRIQAVNTMLWNMNLEVRIYINSRCEELILDFEKIAPGNNNDIAINKSDPKRTHASDAFGYIIAHEFPVQRPSAGQGSYAHNFYQSASRF